LGKALSAGVRGIFQAIAIIVLALIMRIGIILNPVSIIGVCVLVVLLSMCFACLSMALASFFRTRERMMGIGQVITMPVFFASNAIYPLSIMPGWLKPIAEFNPLSYTVDAIRVLFATGNYSSLPKDFVAILIATIVLITITSLSFRRIIS
jgi:ABC-2 type transport system permease protein